MPVSSGYAGKIVGKHIINKTRHRDADKRRESDGRYSWFYKQAVDESVLWYRVMFTSVYVTFVFYIFNRAAGQSTL